MSYSIVLLMGSCFAYYIFSSGYDKKDIRVNLGRFLLSGSFLCAVDYMQDFNKVSSVYLLFAVVYLLWVFCVPYINYKSYSKKNAVVIDNSREIIVGLLMTSSLIYIYLLSNICMMKEISFFTICAVFALFSLIPAFFIVHYCIYGICPMEASIKAINETYWREAKEYIFSHISISQITVNIIGVVVFLGSIYYFYVADDITKVENLCVYVGLLLSNIFLIGKNITKINLYGMYKSVKKRAQNDRDYKKYGSERIVELYTNSVLPDVLAGSVIFIIGESASRDYMHVYNPQYKFQNTPWLTTMKDVSEMTIFGNAFACYNQTADVLKRVLTEMSQYNSIEFNRAATLIDVAKKIGYKTYWISNQGSIAFENSPEALIAGNADYVYGNKGSRNFKYDHELLGYLDCIDPTANNFIVLHIEGSHGQYKLRYPQSFGKWPSTDEESAYNNTLLYTDLFLEKVHEYAVRKLHLQLMVYFSDHGDNIKYGHHPDVRTPDTVRIPMFVKVSKEYLEKFPAKVSVMKKNRKEYFSNDMIYNTMLGLMNVRCSRYDAKEDITSEQYGFNKDNVKTFLGEVMVKDYE